MTEITLEDVKRLRLKEGDTLVLHVGTSFSMEQIARMREDLREAFPDHKTIVLGGDDLQLEVVEKPA